LCVAMCRLWRGHRPSDRSESHTAKGPAICQTTEEASSIGLHGSGLLMADMWGIHRESGPRLEEGAVDDFVPICCFFFKVRDDKNMEVGKGPWVDLNTYALSRQLPLSHGFVFTHGYCPDCVAHFDERMAAYRPTTVWESLREAGRRLIAGTGGGQRDIERFL